MDQRSKDAPPFAGLIFDFNGVLLWDNALHEEAWRRYSARLRGYPMTDREMVEQVHGKVNLDIFRYLLGRPVAREATLPLAAEKEAIYRQLCLEAGDAFRLSPGAVDLLDFLVAHDIPHTIATSSGGPNVAFFIEHLELGRWFDLAKVVFDEGRYPGKPAPYIYLEAAGKIGLLPSRCMVVEDSLAGVESARAAGIGCIVGLGPDEWQRQLADLPRVGPLIRDLGEFPRELLALKAGAVP
jgi:beta-phosphoglucomutase-like phosphatase (HAD superfamily)